VDFRDDSVDPPLYDVGQQQVACLLYRDTGNNFEPAADDH
jgi:hypothetical protein